MAKGGNRRVHPQVLAAALEKALDNTPGLAHHTRAGPSSLNLRTSNMQHDDEDLLAELDLGPSPDPVTEYRITGALPTANFFVDYARDLTQADVAALSLPRNSKANPLVRIHSSHHSLARCMASGMKQSQAALVTGYNPSRISILMHDPTFQALVADYKAEVKSAFADLAERMTDMSLDAIEILHERLQESPETFTIPVLVDVVKAFADRTGHGPGQEVHLKVDRDFIDRPPRESIEEWKARRAAELSGAEVIPLKGITEVKQG